MKKQIYKLLTFSLLVVILILSNNKFIYIFTVKGDSMIPSITPNEIIVCMPKQNYEIGDVVVYYLEFINHAIIHRVIDIKNDRYYLKGDNNDFVDPFAIKKERIICSINSI